MRRRTTRVNETEGVGYSVGWHHDATRLARALLQIIVGEETCFASSITNNHTSFLGGLNIGLEVTPNAVTYCDKREGFFVKYITVIGGKFKKPLGKLVVILLLLDCVVEGRVA